LIINSATNRTGWRLSRKRMSKIVVINLQRFFVLVFIQVFLLKNISLYNLSTPYLYILFLLLLPFDTPNWLLFPIAFVTGLTIDAFYDTPGLNAAASVVLVLVRILFISVTVQKDKFDNEPEPTLSMMGLRWFFTYTLTLTLVHHFFLFIIESFNLSGFGYTIGRFIFSSIFTIILILISSLIFFRRKERK
jgi:rod shape-determining protein MreD